MNKRQKKLLELLLINPTFKPVSYYAESLGVSPRSIHNYLSSLQPILDKTSMHLETKPGTGIRLVGGNFEKISLSLELESQIKRSDMAFSLSTKQRQRKIAEMLILDEQVITYQSLADKFYVSISSIANDFNVINSMFDNFTAKLMTTRKGTSVVGTELQKQITIVEYLNVLLKEEELYGVSNSYDELIVFLSKYFDKELVRYVVLHFDTMQKELTFMIKEKYLYSLLIMLIVFLTRLKSEKHPVINRDFIFNEIKVLDSYVVAEQIVKRFSSNLEIDYIESDIDYLNKQLIAHNIQLSYQSESHDEFSVEVKQLIKVMSEVLEIDLNDDQVLYKGLLSHFTPMIYRLKMNIHVKNPILNEIREQYSIVFSGMWYAISTIEDQLNVQMTDNEISFLAVHFQIAVERNSNGKKILIVCPAGIGIYELIYNKIQKIIPYRDTIEICTKASLSERNLSQVDFIISAVDLEVNNVPVIKVSTLITNSDIQRISEFYANIFYSHESEGVDVNRRFKRLAKLIDEKHIFINQNFSNKKQCLEYMIERLVEEEIVDDKFMKSVFAREELGETDMATGVALPHAPPEHVIKSKLTIMTLKNKMLWHNQKVDVVLLLCLSKEDILKVKSILSEIYTLVNSRKRVEYYFLENDTHDIISLLS